MLAHYLAKIFAAIYLQLANHLWQSTVCLVIASALVLILRRDHARARYGIWLAASLKFLVPFSLLIALGARLAPPRAQPSPVPADTLYIEMQQVSQPFTLAPAVMSREQRRPAQPNSLRWWVAPILPAVTVVIWLGGFLFVLARWGERWWRVSKDVRAALPFQEGRELEALQRTSRFAGVKTSIEMRLSQASLEPGILGIFRPILLWPAGISAHLDDAQLEAIFSHEVWHVRRRDNLAAALHMLVEAIFWFHPLVWWLGARMLDERERACDEAVLQLGGTPHVYAESILKTCQFCLESPVACVSGVTGADLKKRIVRIMAQRTAVQLSMGKKVILTVAGIAAIAGPVIFGLMNPPQIRAQTAAAADGPLPSFEVASVRLNRSGDGRSFRSITPERITQTGISVRDLMLLAYNVKDFQLSGGPSWVNKEKYDVEAKSSDDLAAELAKLPGRERWIKQRVMLQGLLVDRFKLKVSHTTREFPIYALVVAKGGPKMPQSFPGDTFPNGVKYADGVAHPGGMSSWGDHMKGNAISTSDLAVMLSNSVGRLVVDQTGLTGKYDVELKWTPDHDPTDKGPESGGAGSLDSFGPSIFTAIQEQLGLKLVATKGPVDFIVIDHIERPSEN